MRRVPSTLISRERSSGSVNDTDAAECTMSVTWLGDAVSRVAWSSPRPGCSMSAGSATSRSAKASSSPNRQATVPRRRLVASASSRARTGAITVRSVRSRYRARISIPTNPVAPVRRTAPFIVTSSVRS